MPTLYRLAADFTVILHLAYVAFVVWGLVAIVGGYWRGWSWVHNRWFRGIHLAMILIVVFEAWWGMTCPLTTWEQLLRDRAGQATYSGSFVGNAVHEFLFFELSETSFTVIYTLFGALVASTLVLVPVRWRNGSPSSPPQRN